jgi:hypothetical protein
LKNTFIKIYTSLFDKIFFIKTRSQSYVLDTVSLSKTTSFFSTEGVLGFPTLQCLKGHIRIGPLYQGVLWPQNINVSCKRYNGSNPERVVGLRDGVLLCKALEKKLK